MVVWFGTREHMQWIPSPMTDIAVRRNNFSNLTSFLNGGASVRRSLTGAKSYELSWAPRPSADIRTIVDYADGVYGTGPFYYCHPFAMESNCLPPYIASPAMNYYDGPFLVDQTRPTLVPNGSSINGFPVESAAYTLTTTSSVPEAYFPIPPGYVAHIGVHGQVLSGTPRVILRSYTTSTGFASSDLTLMNRNAPFVNRQVSSATARGFGITLGGTGEILLHGLIAQVLPSESAPNLTGFVSGQGQTGMDFSEYPEVSEYSFAMNLVGASATLVETEAWKWQ